jgi:hypothetical protein
MKNVPAAPDSGKQFPPYNRSGPRRQPERRRGRAMPGGKRLDRKRCAARLEMSLQLKGTTGFGAAAGKTAGKATADQPLNYAAAL